MDEIYGIIYCARNIMNGKVYIGQTKKSLSNRRAAHESSSEKEDGFYFQRSIRKYGKENFYWSVIDEALSKDELNFLEQYYIDFYCSAIKECGYNLAMGGQFGEMNAETIEKSRISHELYYQSDEGKITSSIMSEKSSLRASNSVWMTNGKVDKFVLSTDIEKVELDGYYLGRREGLFTQNRKGKISICKLQEDGSYLDKKMYPIDAEIFLAEGWERGCGYTRNPSKETREKQGNAKRGKPSPNKGKHLSQEQKDHLSEINKGKVVLQETKEKISKILTGRVFTEEHKEKIGKANTGRKLEEESILKMKITKKITASRKQNIKALDIDFNRLLELNTIF